jgi:hypothetical protein
VVGGTGAEAAVGRVEVLAGEVEALAARARERAGRVAASHPAGWRGEAADRAGAVVDEEVARLRSAAGDLDDLAATLRVHARTAGHRLEEVQRLVAGVAGLLGADGAGR